VNVRDRMKIRNTRQDYALNTDMGAVLHRVYDYTPHLYMYVSGVVNGVYRSS
jgi:hypothetical protein